MLCTQRLFDVSRSTENCNLCLAWVVKVEFEDIYTNYVLFVRNMYLHVPCMDIVYVNTTLLLFSFVVIL